MLKLSRAHACVNTEMIVGRAQLHLSDICGSFSRKILRVNLGFASPPYTTSLAHARHRWSSAVNESKCRRADLAAAFRTDYPVTRPGRHPQSGRGGIADRAAPEASGRRL